MAFQINTDCRIPIQPDQAVNEGWTSATFYRPVGVTWHWTETADLATCRRTLGGANAERKGYASAHFGIGRSFAEGVDEYVSLDNRSWHAGVNQTLQWDGRALTDMRFKGSRTTVGVETCTRGDARPGVPEGTNWIEVADTNGRHVMRVEPWTDEQVEMMIAVGRRIVDRYPNIRPEDHHGHHDLCPGYKQDVAGFPFACVLRGIYGRPDIPDVWTPLCAPAQRQQALLALGFDLGPANADGVWGHMSDAALRKFQREQGMHEDGMWTTFVNWKVYAVMQARGFANFFAARPPSP